MFSEESDHLDNLRLEINRAEPRLAPARLLALLRERTGFSGAKDSKSRVKDTDKHSANDAKTSTKKRSRDDNGEKSSRKRTRVTLEDAISISDTEEGRLFHAYQRVFRIRYTTSTSTNQPCVYENEAASLGWVRDEQALQDWLAAYTSDVAQNETIDLGIVAVDRFSYTSAHVLDPADETHTLITLPALRSTFHSDDYDVKERTRPLRDLLQAFQVLVSGGRAKIGLHLFLVPTSHPTPEELPFTLHVRVDCSIVCPTIFEPIVDSGKSARDTARTGEIQEAQRRVILQLFPPQSPPPSSYHGNTDIPFLFSILRPAPPLPSPQAYDALQPEALLPTLLPFQRRSVGWMLGREGKVVTASGDIVRKSDIDLHAQPLPLFWEQFSVSTEETWYINRLRGLISATRPDGADDDLDDDTLGGIVAEEPGLGKTLECISTIMMNPPPERSPDKKHWDAEAKIDVREIKVCRYFMLIAQDSLCLQTTLIVTPPSLAPQWADELAAHAPSLKVLIYEGWQKVPVPISEKDVAEERERRKRQRTNASTSKKRKGKKPATSAKSKSQGKRGVGDEDMDIDTVTEDERNEDDEEDEVVDWCTYVNTFDVCITTYNVLQQDLGVARPPPTRPRRAFVQYSNVHRSRSPLVMCEWYRVIMDEVQMVGGGKTE